MKLISKIFQILISPRHLLLSLAIRTGMLRYISDETWLKLKFHVCMGYKLDLKNPQTFSEKLQWLKLHASNIGGTCSMPGRELRSHMLPDMVNNFFFN